MHKIIPEGFKDDVSAAVATEHKFKNMIIEHFQSNGFDLVKTPLIEFTENNNASNTFKISVKKNEKKLNIRDDITLQVARLSENRLYKKKQPLKLCYYGEVVRKEGSMLRPERQFQQIGAECIGDDSFLADVEILELAYTSLKLVGIKKIIIEISSRVFYDKFFQKITNDDKKTEIKRLIKLKDLKRILKILDKGNHKYLKDLFECTGIYNIKKNKLDNLGIDKNTSNEISNIKNIVKNFSYKNNDISFFIDLCEIDDKNYHSGVRFTFFSHNVRGEIAKGGRYFVKKFNNNNKVATGFTCYMDSILRASSAKLTQKKILIPFDLSHTQVNKLLKKGYSVFKYNGDLKISRKLSKDYNCEFYFEKNKVKRS